MGEWKKIRFGDLYAIPSRNGVSKPSRVRGAGYKMINMGELFAHDWIFDIPMELVPLTDSEKANSQVVVDDLLFARQSMVASGAGRCVIVREVNELTVFESHLIRVRLDQTKALPLFYYYYFRSGCSNIASIVQHVVQAGIRASDLSDLEVDLPDLPAQRRIAAVLGAFDDKIEVNRKICESLEAQAQALFKAWFVDLEPFGGKRPEGWKEVELPEVFYFQEGPGIRNWQYVTENGVRFINIRCIVDGDIRVDSANMISEEEAYGKYAHFLLQENDIVMSCSGTLGRYAIVRKDHLPLCLNTSVIRFRPKNGFSDFSWLYGYLGSEEFLSQQKALANGSVQANFGPTHLKNMKVMLPDAVTREKYHQAIYSSIQMAQTIRDENKTLAAMRDALLPRLMSGELAVEKVEG